MNKRIGIGGGGRRVGEKIRKMKKGKGKINFLPKNYRCRKLDEWRKR